MQFAGIQKTSTVDFPGVLSAVLFTPGCNFHCFYCHNRALLVPDAPLLPDGEVEAFLHKRAGMLEGIVVSGGEPTLQDDLQEFLVQLKNLGYKVKLDTNGSRPEVVRALLDANLLDYAAVDYKAPFVEYAGLTGQDGEATRETFALLQNAGVAWEARTTLVPQITPEKLRQMAAELPALPKYVLQLYNAQPGDTKHLKTLLPYTPSEVKCMAESIRDLQQNVGVRV